MQWLAQQYWYAHHVLTNHGVDVTIDSGGLVFKSQHLPLIMSLSHSCDFYVCQSKNKTHSTCNICGM